jgi:hypothetical protein
MVECLASKYKALTSSPSTAKIRKTKPRLFRECKRIAGQIPGGEVRCPLFKQAHTEHGFWELLSFIV